MASATVVTPNSVGRLDVSPTAASKAPKFVPTSFVEAILLPSGVVPTASVTI